MTSKKKDSKRTKKTKKKEVKRVVKPPTNEQIKPSQPLLSKNQSLLVLGIFIAISLGLYFQCIPYGFVLDDKIVYSDNAYTKNGFAGISDLISKETFQGYFGEQKNLVEGGRYRPLSLVTFAIEHQFFGLNSKVSHFVNIFLYAICSWIIFLTLFRLIGFSQIKEKKSLIWFSIPFIASLIYLVHPVHTEAVANIKGRDEIMAMIFAMLSLWSSLKYYDKGKWTSIILAGIWFFLGLLSKENVITFLAVIPIAILFFRPKNIKNLAAVSGLLLGVTVIYLLVRYQVIGYLFNSSEIKDVMNNPFYGMTGSEKYATIGYTLFEYLRLCVFPHPLTHDYYPYHIPKADFGDIRTILAIIIHLALIVVSFLMLKKNKLISFGILFYLITLTIISNIVVGVGTFMNERFIFMASLGICILIAIPIHYLLASDKKSIIGKGILALLIILFSIKTFIRVPAWENALSLNTEAIKVSKNSARANSFMGTALFNKYKETQGIENKKKLLDEADIYISQSLAILPNYTNANLMKVGVLSERYKLDRDLDKFLAALKPIAAQKPTIGFITEFCKYLNTSANEAKMVLFYYDLGFNELFKKNKNPRWALHYLDMGYQLNPNNKNINKAMYHIYAEAGDMDRANKHAR